MYRNELHKKEEMYRNEPQEKKKSIEMNYKKRRNVQK